MSETPLNDNKFQNISEMLHAVLEDFKYSSEVPKALIISEDSDHSSIDTKYKLKQFLLKPQNPDEILELIFKLIFVEPEFQIEDLNFSMHSNNTRVLMQLYEEMTNILNALILVTYFDNIFGKDNSRLFAEFMVDKSKSKLNIFFQELIKIPTKILENMSVFSKYEFILKFIVEILKENEILYPFVERLNDKLNIIIKLNELFIDIKKVLKFMKEVKENYRKPKEY